MDSPQQLLRSGIAHVKSGQPNKGERLITAAVKEFEKQGVEFIVFGSTARDLDQVVQFLTGDDHDRTKVQFIIDGQWKYATEVAGL